MTWEQYFMYCGVIQVIAFSLLAYAVIFNKWGFEEIKTDSLVFWILSIAVLPVSLGIGMVVFMFAAPFVAMYFMAKGLKKLQALRQEGKDDGN